MSSIAPPGGKRPWPLTRSRLDRSSGSRMPAGLSHLPSAKSRPPCHLTSHCVRDTIAAPLEEQRPVHGTGERVEERLYTETTAGGRDGAGRARGSPGIHGALSVLEALGAHGTLTLSDLAAELGMPKSTLHRVCAALVERGWALRRRDGSYELGIRALGVGARAE